MEMVAKTHSIEEELSDFTGFFYLFVLTCLTIVLGFAVAYWLLTLVPILCIVNYFFFIDHNYIYYE